MNIEIGDSGNTLQDMLNGAKASAVYVDVGAYNGDTVAMALNICPELKIVAIEPIKSMCDEVKQKFPQVTAVNKACWSGRGTARFYEYEGWGKGLSTLKPSMTVMRPVPAFGTNILQYDIEVDTLDHILQGISTVDYLKVDTEGSEEEVLLGFTKYHQGTKFHIEFHIVNLGNVLLTLKEMGAKIDKVSLYRDPNVNSHVIGAITGKFGKAKAHISTDRITWMKERLGGRIVDIGCADAPITWDVQEAVKVDNRSYEDVAAAAIQTRGTAFPKSEFVQAGAESLPFDNKEFEIALLGEILEHVDDPIVVLKEAKRVAGKVIITVPDEFSWDLRHKPFQNPYHVRHYTKTMLLDHLSKAKIKDYDLGRLDYDGWSFFTVVADLPSTKMVSRVKIKPAPAAAGILSIALLSTPFLTVPPKGYGGLEVVVADIAKGLADIGHKVTIFAPEGSHVDGCEVFPIGEPVNTVTVNWLEAEKQAMKAYAERILSDNFDVVHGNNWFGFEYYLKVKKPSLKILHTHHGGLNMEWWGRSKPPWPLNLISLSKWMQRVYASQGFDSRPIYNGIDMGKYGFKENKGERLIFVGRVDTFKQPHVAIEVANKLGLGLDLVAGTFVYAIDYMQQVKEICDGKQIRWIEEPPQNEKVRLIQDAKCLLFPSKMGEPMGLVACEAMACGTPVVALNDGAIAEVVENGVTGFVCQTADEMCEAVKRIDSISPRACRERVERLFSKEVAARNYEAAYMDIIQGRDW